MKCIVAHRRFHRSNSSGIAMGRQVNFYMSDQDELRFLTYLNDRADTVVVKAVQSSPDPIRLSSLPLKPEPFWFAMYLWNHNISPPPVYRFISEQQYYCLDNANSEVIEFDRCGVDGGRLIRGRIWAEMIMPKGNGGPSNDRCEQFRKWFDALSRWIKGHSVRDSFGDYVFPGARAFAQEGGRLLRAIAGRAKTP